MTHPSDTGPAPVLALKGLSKSFGAVRALRDVSLELFPGEVHALAGENGAGKSTLIKTLAGVHRPDAGQVLLDGAPVVFHGPGDARDAGIAVIYQEPTLFPDLSIAENIFMGRQPRRALGRIDHRATRDATAALMKRLGVELDPDRPARGLSIADQQIVEIAKALSFDARVLIMDEPTAALTGSEVARLFGVVRTLREQGAAVLFISHRLEEIRRIGDRVTVLKDGRAVARGLPAKSTPTSEVVSLMTGRNVEYVFPPRPDTPPVKAAEPVLTVENLSRRGEFASLDLQVRPGEIVGLAGLVGSGRSEILETIYGARKPDNGRVLVDGKPLRPGSVRAAVRAGLGLAPEERKAQALLMLESVTRNVSVSSMSRFARAGWIDRGAELGAARAAVRELSLRPDNPDVPVRTLSGGNQQKAVLARWLLRGCRVLLLDEPTRGVDVGARAELYAVVRRLADDGLAVLLVSSEVPEVLGLADRVLVLREGSVVHTAPARELDEHRVLDLVMEGSPAS